MWLAVGALIAVQVGALAIYRAVERGRETPASPSFGGEVVTGRLAPDLDLVRLDGSHLSVAGLRGRTVLVHFWATWCPPCREELPGLVAAARALQKDGLVLLAVSVDDDWATVRDYFGGDVPPEVVRAATPDAHHLYDVFTLPDTYLVSRDGRLTRRYGGARDWRSTEAAHHLAELVGD
ncbi:MAG TPA: TlpA disulfide reductase family protein [Kofleriaceae bacterium]|nr:TlpA disulfide reductase family protein [Kofleriaceae bacterium]